MNVTFSFESSTWLSVKIDKSCSESLDLIYDAQILHFKNKGEDLVGASTVDSKYVNLTEDTYLMRVCPPPTFPTTSSSSYMLHVKFTNVKGETVTFTSAEFKLKPMIQLNKISSGYGRNRRDRIWSPRVGSLRSKNRSAGIKLKLMYFVLPVE